MQLPALVLHHVGAVVAVEVPVPAACRLSDDALPPTRAWRLPPRQYANTVARSFGVSIDENELPVDAPPAHGVARFSTAVDGRQVTSAHFAVFQKVAAEIAGKLKPEVETQHGCLEKADEACLGDFLRAYGQRAFRRPLEDEELTVNFPFVGNEGGGRNAARNAANRSLSDLWTTIYRACGGSGNHGEEVKGPIAEIHSPV